MREAAFGQDVNRSHEALVQRINSDLANDFGNLAQRVLSFINKNCGARVPRRDLRSVFEDAPLAAATRALRDIVRKEFEQLAFHRALEAIWDVVGRANRYVDEQAPWALRKTEPERMEAVLYLLADVIRQLAILVQPVIPAAAAKLLDQLGVPDDLEHRNLEALGLHPLKPGTVLPKPEGIFPRYVEA